MKYTLQAQKSQVDRIEDVQELHSESARGIDSLLTAFGGTWPPKPDFTDWPDSWRPFVELCDAMSANLLGWKDPTRFRRYIEAELESHINLEAVMADIEAHAQTTSRKLLGFMGCLAVLKNAYRWAAIPVTKEEQARTTLTFPPLLDEPVKRIAAVYGCTPIGHVFSLIFANTIYDEDDSELPVHTRFHFNVDDEIIHTEEGFYLPFTHSEVAYLPALKAMRDYMELTAQAQQSQDQAVAVLAKRVELLKVIKSTFMNIGKVIMLYATEERIQEKYWSHYAQNPTAWGLDGNGGASGGENIVFQTLDEFLIVPGECLMYKNKHLRRPYMPTQLTDIINALHTENVSSRFDSFLNIPKEKDPVLAAKDAILNAVYLWRLNHAHVAKRYLKRCDMLSSNLDKKMDIKTSLADVTAEELRIRARETASQMQKNCSAPIPRATRPVTLELAPPSGKWGNYLYKAAKSVFGFFGEVIEYTQVVNAF